MSGLILQSPLFNAFRLPHHKAEADIFLYFLAPQALKFGFSRILELVSQELSQSKAKPFVISWLKKRGAPDVALVLVLA